MPAARQRTLREIPMGRFFRFAKQRKNSKQVFYRVKGPGERTTSVHLHYVDKFGKIATAVDAEPAFMVRAKSFK